MVRDLVSGAAAGAGNGNGPRRETPIAPDAMSGVHSLNAETIKGGKGPHFLCETGMFFHKPLLQRRKLKEGKQVSGLKF